MWNTQGEKQSTADQLKFFLWTASTEILRGVSTHIIMTDHKPAHMVPL